MKKAVAVVTGLFCASTAWGQSEIVEYVHLDAAGNIRAVTNQAGQVVERHDFLPFGEECLTGPCASNPGVGAGQPRKFTGKERDTETGFDYFGARYYQAKWGRFTTIDPVYTWRENLLDPQRWNRYAYARNNPLRYVDPDGRAAREITAAQVAQLQQQAAAAGPSNDGFVLGTLLPGVGLGLTLAPVAMLGVELAPAFWMEAQIAGGTCAASPVCRGGVQDIAEGLSGAPPGPRGDWAQLGGMLRQAARGKGNFGIGSATVEQAEAMGRAWVGEGATLASDGKTLLSVDGLRQYRTPSFKPKLGRHQANLEARSEPAGQWQSNAHVDITDKQ